MGSGDCWSGSDPAAISYPGGIGDLQNYHEHYEYDEVGNILSLRHSAVAGSYTRNYEYETASNRLVSTSLSSSPPSTYDYVHDDRGNLYTMPHLTEMVYNANNELSYITNGASMSAYYQYSSGQRVRKAVEKAGGIVKERIYLGSYERFRKIVSGTIISERVTVHVHDDTGRIAMVELRNTGYDVHDEPDDPHDVLIRYVYSNHLQSASLELDETGAVISYEEYHPYGTTAYQAVDASINAVRKRYRFTGKERDEESGFSYHGARYYISWLTRWAAVDSLQGKYPSWSSYNYVKCNPVFDTDCTGTEGDSDRTVRTEVVVTNPNEVTPDVIKFQAHKAAEDQAVNILYDQLFISNDDKGRGEESVSYGTDNGAPVVLLNEEKEKIVKDTIRANITAGDPIAITKMGKLYLSYKFRLGNISSEENIQKIKNTLEAVSEKTESANGFNEFVPIFKEGSFMNKALSKGATGFGYLNSFVKGNFGKMQSDIAKDIVKEVGKAIYEKGLAYLAEMAPESLLLPAARFIGSKTVGLTVGLVLTNSGPTNRRSDILEEKEKQLRSETTAGLVLFFKYDNVLPKAKELPQFTVPKIDKLYRLPLMSR